VKAVRHRAAFTTVAAESRHLQRPVIEENHVEIPVVIIGNHAPLPNLSGNQPPAATRDTVFRPRSAMGTSSAPRTYRDDAEHLPVKLVKAQRRESAFRQCQHSSGWPRSLQHRWN
jgi:hypothetical protein